MKRKAYQIVFSATLVLVMVGFLSAIFFANPNSSFAASGKKKSQVVAGISAVEHTETQIKQLQGTLNITEDQQKLWDKLVQVMRENAQEMDALTKNMAENTKTMNALEHMKFHSQITEAHLAQLKKLIPPFEAFYNSMSDQQKNVTDMVFRTGKYGKSKRK
jgi:TolA-binding protein